MSLFPAEQKISAELLPHYKRAKCVLGHAVQLEPPRALKLEKAIMLIEKMSGLWLMVQTGVYIFGTLLSVFAICIS